MITVDVCVAPSNGYERMRLHQIFWTETMPALERAFRKWTAAPAARWARLRRGAATGGKRGKHTHTNR